MRSLKDYVQEREMRRTGGTPERASFHSKGYHKYFDGYSEYREQDKKGKTHIRRVYTGVYRTAMMTDREWHKTRRIYAILWLISLAGFLVLVTRPVPSNSMIYTALFEALSICLLMWLSWSMCNYLSAGRRMTQGAFRYASAVSRSSMYTGIAQLLTAAVTLVHALMHFSEVGVAELACAAGLVGCGICVLWIHKVEEGISYDAHLSEEETTSLDAQQITSD